MTRLFLVGVLLASGACGSETDDRPPTLEYVTEAILQPACGNAECHSTFKQEVGDVFDTVEGARTSMVNNGLVLYTNSPDDSQIILAMTVGLPSILNPGGTPQRMPYDSPIPDYDLNIIKQWIASGPPNGDGPVGAQCIPGPDGTTAHVCNLNNQVIECTDGNEGALVMDCGSTQTCVEGACVAH